MIYQYRYRIGEKLDSQILIANAWHSRSDALSSVAVLVGITGAKLGYPIFDSLAGVVVVIMIGKIGWGFMKDSFHHVIETSLDKGTTKKIKETLMNSEGVLDFHNLQSRQIGNKYFVDVNVQVDDQLKVSDGHEIGAWIVNNLKKSISRLLTDLETLYLPHHMNQYY